ncbi:uncharacterized protein TrAFT101_006583 [Trichoderma asperellum]|uniref:uncharacterized protein n=1 Tax=Trichoderma asperellum TaxID=101201 RepID=UPI00331F5A38|nr:hypothetical protein TrAFT101_006583 [Trichoderma asperellum]
MESNSHDNTEEAASLDTKPKETLLNWQLKATLAGRSSLPSSRLKRKLDERESPESTEYGI